MVQNILLAILFGGIFTFCFGGVGIFLITRYRAARQSVADSAKWPSTPGRITFSGVSAHVPDREVDSSRSATYEAIVEYTYTVQGVEYHGNRLGFTGGGTTSGLRSDAEKTLIPYPVGATAAVFYDPYNPSESVLQRKIQNQTAFLVMIVIFLLLGLTACGISVYAIVGEIIKAL